jgi:hypothetical protein
MEKNKKNPWMIATFCLAALLVLETALIVWGWNLGQEEIEFRNDCSIDCYDQQGSSYYYDSSLGMCYCFDEQEEIIFSRDMKNKG